MLANVYILYKQLDEILHITLVKLSKGETYVVPEQSSYSYVNAICHVTSDFMITNLIDKVVWSSTKDLLKIKASHGIELRGTIIVY